MESKLNLCSHYKNLVHYGASPLHGVLRCVFVDESCLPSSRTIFAIVNVMTSSADVQFLCLYVMMF